MAGVAIAALLAIGGISWAKSVRGTPRDDVLAGTNHRDRISGLGGNDTIYGRRNADRIRGGTGNDIVYAGTGNDTVLGGAGRDALYGGLASDRLYAGRGADFLYGGPGDDDLWAQDRADVSPREVERSDTVNGGPDTDRIHVRDGEPDRVACGPGYDTVLADRADQVAPNCERVRRRSPR
jgi:Ca2+-binding RTX toxin-like protein